MGGIRSARGILELYSRLINEHFAVQTNIPLPQTLPLLLPQTQLLSLPHSQSHQLNDNSHKEIKLDQNISDQKFEIVENSLCSGQEHSSIQEHSSTEEHSSSVERSCLLKGTIRLSRSNGTSGIFIAKFRKKSVEEIC